LSFTSLYGRQQEDDDTVPDDSATTCQHSSTDSNGLALTDDDQQRGRKSAEVGGGSAKQLQQQRRSLSPRPGRAKLRRERQPHQNPPSSAPPPPPDEVDEKVEEPFEAEPNDWHMTIEDENWDQLERMLQAYDVQYFKTLRERMERDLTREKFLADQQLLQQQQSELENPEDVSSTTTDTPTPLAERILGGLGDMMMGTNNILNSPKTPAATKRQSIDQLRTSYSDAQKRARDALLRSPPGALVSPVPASPFLDKAKSKLRKLGLGGMDGRFYNNTIHPFPLMAQENDGRTPLHLACLIGAPDKLVLNLLILERRAVRLHDQEGQLVLHAAIQSGRNALVLDKLIKAHPNALKQKDKQGRSPIGLAVELAKAEQIKLEPKKTTMDEADRTWACQIFSKGQSKFQIRQDKCWNTVEFLVRQLNKRNKSVLPSEHGLLVQAVESGAPPYVIGRFLTCTAKYLSMDDELAASTLHWVIQRQYSLGILQQLLGMSREKTTIMMDATFKALEAHYQTGCHAKYDGVPAFGMEIIDWSKERNRRRDNQNRKRNGVVLVDEDEESVYMDGVSAAGVEWWEKLQHLLAYCAYGKDYPNNEDIEEHHLVQAALSIAASPPSLISLLLTIYPNAKTTACPVYKALPIHLACSRWKYDILTTDKGDHVLLGKVVKQLLSGPGRETLYIPHRQRLPLHMALAVGQSWSMVSVLTRRDPACMGMRDPATKLFPFQLAAVKLPTKNRALLLRMLYTPAEWRDVPSDDKRTEFARVEELQDARQIGTIFELLRSYPEALRGRVQYRNNNTSSSSSTIIKDRYSNSVSSSTSTTSSSNNSNSSGGKYKKKPSRKTARDLAGVGRVASHYLAWHYKHQGEGGDGWVIRPNNIRMLRDAILQGEVPKGLKAWFNRLKELIWNCYPGDKHSLPHNQDELLLHAALFNPDTPPLIIELLLKLYPAAVTQPVPGTERFPLHIAASTLSYVPQRFEIPSTMDALQLVLNAYPRAVKMRLHGQLPLHIAIARGKTKWKELQPLVEASPKTLLETDPRSRSASQGSALYPFQVMAASRIQTQEERLRTCRQTEKHLQHFDMDELTSRQRGLLLKKIQKNYNAEILTSIYELLRHGPEAIQGRTTLSRPVSSNASYASHLLSPVPQRPGQSGIATTLEAYLLKSVDSLSTMNDSTSQFTFSSFGAASAGSGGAASAAAFSRTSPKTRNRSPTLSAFLNAPSLETPIPSGKRAVCMQRARSGSSTSLSSMSLQNALGGSMGDAFDNAQSKSSYDDSFTSGMGSSVHTANLLLSPAGSGAGMLSPTSHPSSSRDSSPHSFTKSPRSSTGRLARKGRKRAMRSTPIRLPDL
jgi:hypothetical protein